MPEQRDHIRVFTPGGTKAHLLHPAFSPNTTAAARCGRWPGFGAFWYGTGAQWEYEEAARRPLCSQCERRAPTPTAAPPVTPEV